MPTSSSDALKKIMMGYSGSMAVVFKTLGTCGGPAGKIVAAIYSVVNGSIAGTVGYYNNPTPDEVQRLGQAAFSFCTGVAGGILVPAGAAFLVGLSGPPGWITAAVAVGAAGITGVANTKYSGSLYQWIMSLLPQFTSPTCTIGDPSAPDPFLSYHVTQFFSYQRPPGRPGPCPLPPPPWPPKPSPPPRVDPLVLDLDGDGIQTTNVNAGALFDQDGNGFAERTGWVAPGDGLLVMDRNGDGIINNGRELFGSETLLKDGSKAANGFQALAELDANHDGKIDASDPAFSQLRVWQDANGDGYSQAGELHTLDELGIKSMEESEAHRERYKGRHSGPLGFRLFRMDATRTHGQSLTK